ncbi:hypothetical protein ACFL5G_05875 [Candidatus Margulisiibacteriota bacterium]
MFYKKVFSTEPMVRHGYAEIIKIFLQTYINIIGKKDRSAIILGAGEGNDLPLTSLSRNYTSIAFIDKNSAALDRLKKKMPSSNRKQVFMERNISPAGAKQLGSFAREINKICTDCRTSYQLQELDRIIMETFNKGSLRGATSIYPRKADLVIASMVLHWVAYLKAQEIQQIIDETYLAENPRQTQRMDMLMAMLFEQLLSNTKDLVKENGRCMIVLPTYKLSQHEFIRYTDEYIMKYFKNIQKFTEIDLNFYFLEPL